MPDIRDTLNDPNTPVWDMLADGGINLDLVNVDAAGVWTLASGDMMIAFGPAETETGEAAEGWNWARYERDGDRNGDPVTQDWAPTDEALLDILRSA